MHWAAKLHTFWAKRRFWLLCAVLCLLIWALWSAATLKLDTSLKPLLPDSSAQTRQTVDLLELAPFSTIMLVQLTAPDASSARTLPQAADDFLAKLSPDLAAPLIYKMPDLQKTMAILPALCTSQCLEIVQWLTTEAEFERSLAAIKENLSTSQNLFWRLDPTMALSWAVFAHFPQNQAWIMPDPITGYHISPDGRRLLLMLKPKISMNDTEGSKALMAGITRLTAELPSGISAQITGTQRHTAANAEAIENDLRLTMSLALLFILAIYLFLVRSWGAFWLFLTPAVAVLAAAAILGAVFPVISGLALGFGAAVLGIAEDYAVHVHYALRRAGDKAGALSHIARPLLMSALLCAAGFGVLFFSAIPAIRQLAFFSAAAIMVGYLWAIVVLPHCPAMDRPREASAPAPAGAAQKGRVKGLWPLTLGLFGLSVFLISQVPIELAVKAMGLADPEIRRDDAQMVQLWQSEGRRLYLVPGETLEEAVETAGRLAHAMNEESPDSASSIAPLLPPLAEQKANIAAWRNFMAANGPKIAADLAEAAHKTGFAPGAFNPFLEWFLAEPQIITPQTLIEAGYAHLVEYFLLGSPEKPFVVVLAENAAPELPPEFAECVISLAATDLERALSQALAGEKRLLPFCVIICLLILGLTFRDINRALLAFIPALAALAAVLALQLILGRPLGLAEAAALPLIICLGADYGIVVVSELIDNADLGAGRAIFVSGLSTIAGIGILILAQHPVLYALGRTVSIGLLVAMPVSILLLPKMYTRA